MACCSMSHNLAAMSDHQTLMSLMNGIEQLGVIGHTPYNNKCTPSSEPNF